MKAKKIIFTALSIFLIYSFLLLHANPEQEIQQHIKTVFNNTTVLVNDLIKTNDRIDILDDTEIEQLAKSIAQILRLLLPIVKKFPQDKKEPPIPHVQSSERKAQIDRKRAGLLKAIGILHITIGAIHLNKEHVDFSELENNKISQALIEVSQHLSNIQP